MLTKAFATQYRDAASHRVPDLVEAAGLIALFTDAEPLPVVEIPRQVQVESLASHHRAMKAASAVKLQGEGFHVADGEDVVDGGGLTGVPVTRGCRFLSPSSRYPDIGPGYAGQREGDVPTAARHCHVERRSGRRAGRWVRLILEVGGRDPIDSRDPIAPTKSGPLRSEERRVGKECRSRWSPY